MDSRQIQELRQFPGHEFQTLERAFVAALAGQADLQGGLGRRGKYLAHGAILLSKESAASVSESWRNRFGA